MRRVLLSLGLLAGCAPVGDAFTARTDESERLRANRLTVIDTSLKIVCYYWRGEQSCVHSPEIQ